VVTHDMVKRCPTDIHCFQAKKQLLSSRAPAVVGLWFRSRIFGWSFSWFFVWFFLVSKLRGCQKCQDCMQQIQQSRCAGEETPKGR
jgi:hypothetical protein